MSLNWKKFSILPAVILMAGTVAMAQSTTTTTPDPSIAQRKENQQDRIANGVQSGQLTAEKTQINQQQNKLSGQIYQDKHNAATQKYGNSEVGQRQTNQQQRIAQGIKSGQLTAGETAKLENNQRAINQQTRADRAANGGKLTGGEKAQINHEQNQQSKNIYNKKHNGRTQPGAKK
jgi:hypothetical protein